MGISGGTEVKALELYDCVPPEGLKSNGRVVLMGDSLHQMSMCKSDMFCLLFLLSIPRQS